MLSFIAVANSREWARIARVSARQGKAWYVGHGHGHGARPPGEGLAALFFGHAARYPFAVDKTSP